MTTGKDASQVQGVPAVGNLDSALSRITRTASENTAKSAQMAAEQRDWQERQNALAMQFNAQEAAKSRSWQEYMSNTAHQREIRDLKRPVLIRCLVLWEVTAPPLPPVLPLLALLLLVLKVK